MGRKFDVIIFNEVLYCFRDLMVVFKKTRRLLKPGGHIVVSMSETSHSEKVWGKLFAEFPAPALTNSVCCAGNKLWSQR